MDYIQPTLDAQTFTCPHCQVVSQQLWATITHKTLPGHMSSNFKVGHCVNCRQDTLWLIKKIVYPVTGNTPKPNPDLPKDIKIDYEEASDIVTRSPRSACVLLRLCIEKICVEQNTSGNSLNEKIGNLVKKGLDKSIAKSLDSIRVIGGQAIHPLEMDLRDNQNIANTLFKSVNYISKWAHTRPKDIDDIYESIPDSKKDAIDKRDNPK